ncbi:Glucan 1,3-beta-glucosidase [Lecanosticta acicola]|uniref:Glucan 1,3-beta-glucosidase n=1 Tax=Lecanosticta acicola TaxID=111012 RepID=A0AAI9EB84_9PEZI|nr:Glucan 1,3-beta-glucosidase [Lecanosticta acicola]
MPLSLIESLFFFLSVSVGLSGAQQQYRNPAPAYIVKPDPTAYIDFLPNNPGHGIFRDKNTTVTPWSPINISGLLPEYGRPEACGVETPAPQSRFWLPDFQGAQEGISPFLVNGHRYKVFRNVKDYGAVGDGVTDDTDAFNRAITEQSRMGGGRGSGGVTGQPALIYIPSGTYSISSSIQLFIDTQVIGDPIDPPTIKASSIMNNNTILIDGYDFGMQSTNNFYIGLRNIILDTSGASSADTIYALNWAVSQATNLVNVNVTMPVGSQHIGLEMDGGSSGGGSGLFMGDLAFEGGLIGILFSNQQYAIKNVKLKDIGTGIAVRHAFVLALQGIECENVGICVDAGQIDITGSVSLIDSSCDTCGVVVNGSANVLLENIDVNNSGPTLKINGTSRGISNLVGKTYASGHVYKGASGQPVAANGTFLPYTQRGSLVDASGKYFTKKQPQYEDLPASAFASVRDAGAKGDGVHDDTKAIQQALLSNAGCKVTYFPHGIYIVTDTIYVPPGSRIVGQVWSTISASGKAFADDSAPKPMIQVGKAGEVGLAEFTDMLFTVADVLPGAILVEVNMKGANQGDVSFHNSHFRIGGAVDSRTETACQTISDPCKAAFLVMHLRKTSSSYIENAWLWSADHDLDGVLNQQIGTGRGMLIEATQGTWLVGTGSEHHTLYAYQLDNAQNVYASLMQVESPYWQPLPRAPAPWTPDPQWNDPDFAGCKGNVSQCYMQWALRIVGADTHTLALYGQGFWTFFNGPNYGSCTGPNGNCQINIVDFAANLTRGDGVGLFNLNTKGVQNMVTLGGSGGKIAVAASANAGSWGGVLAAYLGFQ